MHDKSDPKHVPNYIVINKTFIRHVDAILMIMHDKLKGR